MKQIEKLFEAQNYDAKCKLNRSNKVVPATVIESIEREGITLEAIEALNVPVFRYRTQCTIHGHFPDNLYNIDRYKSVIVNGNGSIGVKWRAIDYAKKKHIFRYLRHESWKVQENSTDYYAYLSSRVIAARNEVPAILEEMRNKVAHINPKLFFGNVGIGLYQLPYLGYVVQVQLNIGGILQSNVAGAIENITRKSIAQLDAEIADKQAQRAKEDAEREAQYQAAREAENDLKLPAMEALTQQLIDAGYERKEVPIANGTCIVLRDWDSHAKKSVIKYVEYHKEARQKKMRMTVGKFDTLEALQSFLAIPKNERNRYWGNEQQTLKTSVVGFVLPVADKPVDAIVNEPQKIIGDMSAIVVVKYSDKAIAIFGDTKPIKESLKGIGAKFNPRLQHEGITQAGWVLPVSKSSALDAIGISIQAI